MIVVETFDLGDTVKIEGVVTKVHSDGSVSVDTPAGRRRYFVAEDVNLVKKAPKPVPVEPMADYAIVKLTDEHGKTRVAVRRQGFSYGGPNQYAWLVSGYPGAYSWKTMLDRFGRKDVREVTAVTPLRTKPIAPTPAPDYRITIEPVEPAPTYHPYAYVDDIDRVHFRDAPGSDLYRHADDPEEKLTVRELARENACLKALHLEGERP